jgi:hypothetical protein
MDCWFYLLFKRGLKLILKQINVEEITMKHKTDNQDHQNDLPDAVVSDVDDSRRKFNKTGLIAPVMLSLSSKPVWAFDCTPSILASGNLSMSCTNPPNGYTIDQWKNADQWPIGLKKDDKFDSIFGVVGGQSLFGTNATLQSVLSSPTLNASANLQTAFGCTGSQSNISTNLPGYAQQSIASALNDLYFPNYAYPGTSTFYSAVHGNSCQTKGTNMATLTTYYRNLTT